jgi:hypothetical protein
VPLAAGAGACGAPPKRISIYVGHDTTFLPLLAALLGDGRGLDWVLALYGGWPPYAAVIAFELLEMKESSENAPGTSSACAASEVDSRASEINGRLFVRVLFNGKPLPLHLGRLAPSPSASLPDGVVSKATFDRFVGELVELNDEDAAIRDEADAKWFASENRDGDGADQRPQSAHEGAAAEPTERGTQNRGLQKTQSWRVTRREGGTRAGMWPPSQSPRRRESFDAHSMSAWSPPPDGVGRKRAIRVFAGGQDCAGGPSALKVLHQQLSTLDKQ